MGRQRRRDSVQQPDLSVLGPIREIIRLVEEGKRSKSQLQAFVEGVNPFEVSNPIDIDGVITILGADRVITYDQACEAFGQDKRGIIPAIHYTEETIRKCAELNHSGQCDWWFIYAHGFSFREQSDIIGMDMASQPCFSADDWWFGDAENTWAKSQPKAGYYLIDMKGRFNRTRWDDQNVRITEMGEQYERADERVFTQALISIFKTHEERLHSGTYHWGWIEGSNDFRLFVGCFDPVGLSIFRDHPSSYKDYLFVCVAWKWEI